MFAHQFKVSINYISVPISIQNVNTCIFTPLFNNALILVYCGISSLLHSVSLILFSLLLVTPHPTHITSSQSPPSLSSPITPSTFNFRLKTHLFHKSFPPQSLLVSYSFRNAFMVLNLYCIKGGLALFCFSFWLRVLD